MHITVYNMYALPYNITSIPYNNGLITISYNTIPTKLIRYTN